MKRVFAILFVLTSIHSYGQTDTDIVKATMGKPFHEMSTILDSLKVWYVMHVDNDQEKAIRGAQDRKKIYSISDGNGSVKVWAYVFDLNNKVEEIVINFRHDSRQQVEDSRKLKAFSDFHVGLYSTDFVFKRKK